MHPSNWNPASGKGVVRYSTDKKKSYYVTLHLNSSNRELISIRGIYLAKEMIKEKDFKVKYYSTLWHNRLNIS